MRYQEDGKFRIKAKDLSKPIVLIKNHQDQQELMNVQAGALSGNNNLLPIPIESFEKYNKFRVKHKRKALKETDCLVIDVNAMKQERAKEEFDKANEFFKG